MPNLKTTFNKSILFILLFIFINQLNVFAQVGVGTTGPEAALDISSSSHGFLMPRIALVATNIPTVTNPNGGALEVGTMVFNTATTTGTYKVQPGLYFWDGAFWVSNSHQYYKTNFTQTTGLSVVSSASYTDIPGLNSKTFTAPYSGEYQIIFSGYLGTDEVYDQETSLDLGNDISGYASVGYVEGIFKLNVNGSYYDKYSYSTSFYRSGDGVNGADGLSVFQLFNEITVIATVNLVAGQVCTVNASYMGDYDDNIDSFTPHIVGDSGSLGNLCEINVTYLGR